MNKNQSKKVERKVVLAAVVGAILITLGFTISQGNVKNKEDDYVSPKSISEIKKYAVKEEDYKVTLENEEEQKYKIECSEEFNTKEIAYITNELIKKNEKMKDGYELNLYVGDKEPVKIG